MHLPASKKLLFLAAGFILGYSAIFFVPRLAHAANFFMGKDQGDNFIIRELVGATTPTPAVPIFQMSRLGAITNANINAAQLSSGTFGANTGNGNFTFPANAIVNGNLGIGTTAPAYKLQVSGTVQATDLTCTDCLAAGDIAAGAVGTSEIANGSIADVDIATDTILATSIAAGAVTTTEILDSTILTGDIALDTILAVDIAAGAVGTSEILDGTIAGADILDGTILAADIGADAITASELATSAVTTSEILDSTILTGDIALDTILAGDIAAGAVGTSEIANGSIADVDIATDTILATSIAAGAVGTSEIANGTVSSTDILNATILSADIAANTIAGSNILDATILAADIGADAITASELAANAVGDSELMNGGTWTLSSTLALTGALSATSLALSENYLDSSPTHLSNYMYIDAGAISANRSYYNQMNHVYADGTDAVDTKTVYDLYNRIYIGNQNRSADADSVYGTTNYIIDYAVSGTTGSAVGTYNWVRNYGYGNASSAQTITNMYGTYNYLDHDYGTTTNAYGVYNTFAGTIGTTYGIYNTGEDYNYFSNNVGIGVTAPAYKLQVSGTVQATDLTCTDCLGAGDIAAGAVGTSEIADSSIADADIATDTILATSLAPNSVGTSEITDSSIADADIATDTILATSIAAGAVGTSEILNATILSADIAANTIAGSNILDATILAADIGADAIGSSELSANSVTGSELMPSGNWPLTGTLSITGGNVGIGTTVPGMALNVVGAIRASGNIQTTARLSAGAFLAGSSAALDVDGGISVFGNVGIGDVTPTYKLDITSVAAGYSARIYNAVANGGGLVVYAGTSGNTSSYGINLVNSAGTVSHMHVRNDGYGYLQAAVWAYGSDRRMKENISYFDQGMSVISKLLPVRYDYIEGQKNQLGFISQDVQPIIPEAVSVADPKTGYLALKYDFILPYLVNAVKEQQQEISGNTSQLKLVSEEFRDKFTSQEDSIDALKKELAEQQKEIEELKKTVEELRNK